MPTDFDEQFFLQKLRRALGCVGWEANRTIVAVSGGADSVALLCGLCRLGHAERGLLVAAHFNHRLRGCESDQDEEFVRSLCSQLGIPLVVGCPSEDLPASPGKGGIERLARVARYRFLLRTAQEQEAKFLLTAHTADDQVETVLFRLIRGSGLCGLTGIPSRRKVRKIIILRPFLGFWRAETEEFLAGIGQGYRVDSSNLDMKITRNRVRRELIPLLESAYHPGVRYSILRLSQLASDLIAIIDPLVNAAARKAIVREDFAKLVIDAPRLARYPDLVVGEVLRRIWLKRGWPLGEMTRRQWRRLIAMVRGAAGRNTCGNSAQEGAEPAGGQSPQNLAIVSRSLNGDVDESSYLAMGVLELALRRGHAVEERPRVPRRWMFPGGVVAEISGQFVEIRPTE